MKERDAFSVCTLEGMVRKRLQPQLPSAVYRFLHVVDLECYVVNTLSSFLEEATYRRIIREGLEQLDLRTSTVKEMRSHPFTLHGLRLVDPQTQQGIEKTCQSVDIIHGDADVFYSSHYTR